MLLSLLLLIGMSWGIWKIACRIFERAEEEEPEEVVYSQELHASIQRIADLDREIQLMRDMIIELDMGWTDNVLNRMTVSWKRGGSYPEEAKFPAWDGAVTQDKLRELARARKQELIEELTKELDALPIRHKQNVDKILTMNVAEYDIPLTYH